LRLAHRSGNIVAAAKGKAMIEKPRREVPRMAARKLADSPGFDLDRALRSIVTVQSSIPEDAYTAQILGEQRTGSGVVIRESGLVLTIGYLITEAETVWIARYDGRVIPGHALAIDQESGFGLVQALDRLDCPALELGRSTDVRIGDSVVVAAGGGTKAVHASVVAKQEFAGYWEYFLEEAIFTSPAHPFWGGAGAIDASGRLLGVGSLHVEQLTMQGGPRDINMIVPIDLLPPILDDLLTYGRVNKPALPWLGIYSAESGDEVVVAALAERGPAASAGLRHGDILASVRGAEIADLGDFYRKVWRCGEAGAEVPVEIIRDGRALGLKVQSADRTAFLKRPRLQ
jgi:S1-C subfamily serine protease